MIFDTHCHLQFQAYKEDREDVIKRCLEKNTFCNLVGTQIDTSRAAVELAEKYENFYATIGLYPVHVSSTEVDEEEIVFQSREEDFDETAYAVLAQSKKVVAVGECGLDLFHLSPDQNRDEVLAKQKAVFLKQINFAEEHNLALVIHVRDAHPETIDVLKSLNRPIRGVMHCYTGNWEYAEEYLNLGLYLGFTGVVTFPAKKTDPRAQENLLKVVEMCPLERILSETDAPYLAPQSYRGQRAEPWMVAEVAAKIALTRSVPEDIVIQATVDNAKMLFGLTL